MLGNQPGQRKGSMHRARALLRKRLYGLFGSKVSDLFRFHLLRCDRMVQRVSRRTRHDLNPTWPMKAAVLGIEMPFRRPGQSVDSEELVDQL